MQNNKFALQKSWTEHRVEENADPLHELQQENEKLTLENVELKKNLEKEKLLHSTLYKEWAELNASINGKSNELDKYKTWGDSQYLLYKYGFFGLIILTVVLAVSTYNLSTGSQKNTSAVIQPIEQVSASKIPDQKNNKPLVEKKVATEAPKSTEPPVTHPVANTAVESSIDKTFATSASGHYRIIAKSFFCNEPDESTRRNTFLLPDSTDYGVVNALDDQNGFIYIVFVNHAGRTSKGWISKRDLEPIE